jgi:hydrogenase expression/formation protein HypC
MCLAIPGKILTITGSDLLREGKVDFGGVLKIVNLSLVPDAQPGDYVIVHVGVALNVLSEAQAEEILEDFKQIEALDETFGEPE